MERVSAFCLESGLRRLLSCIHRVRYKFHGWFVKLYDKFAELLEIKHVRETKNGPQR